MHDLGPKGILGALADKVNNSFNSQAAFVNGGEQQRYGRLHRRVRCIGKRAALRLVTTRRGILPELVRDRVTGRSVEESAPALSEALLELWRDEAGRREMGEAARRDACDRFDLRRQVDAVRETYRAVLEVAS